MWWSNNLSIKAPSSSRINVLVIRDLGFAIVG
jgi:hypothetical protein